MEIVSLTASQITTLIASRRLSSFEVAEAFLERIDRLNPKIEAWVNVDAERVLADANKSDEKRSRGCPMGRLEGVPVGFKDIFFTKGIPTTACSEIYKDLVPEYDAKSVELIKEADGIMLGKTVTTEFAWTDPSPTKNPWNFDHTPGGSSSGSAAAVAAKMCPVAFGSQTVGSVLRPAAYCGVVGFKPTFQSVDRYGLIPFSPSSDTVGWISRSVEDIILLWSAVRISKIKELEGVGKEPTRPMRIGWIGDFFVKESDKETRANFNGVLKSFVAEGAVVEEVELPKSFGNLHRDLKTITEVEGARFHREMFEKDPNLYSPLLAATIENGLNTRDVEYQNALERQVGFKSDMDNLAKTVDVLATPSTPSPAPSDLSTTGNGMFQAPWSASGLPTVTLPSGLSTKGLPFGIQLIGRSFGDDDLLERVSWCESRIGVDLSPAV
ncbi:MAG: amidase [Gemmatimonadetes bacterium]|nr:amidase [Gemmatimonadota bacterium]